jgi:hypothetical protein
LNGSRINPIRGSRESKLLRAQNLALRAYPAWNQALSLGKLDKPWELP